jgi:hypothetical protein
MEPALPDRPSGDDPWTSADDVGTFEQGSLFSRWALARYLVGRAIGESVSNTLLILALGLLGIAAVFEWVLNTTFFAILFLIFAVMVLLLRWALRAVLGRLTAADRYGPVEERLRGLVSDTHSDVLKELRRVGLPGRTITLPLLAVRFVGRRRKDTLTRLRAFEVERAVPKARLDELHMLLRNSLGGPSGGPPGGSVPPGTVPT